MDNNQIQAVHNDDLVTLLNSLGVYNDVLSQKCHCIFCNQIITPDNIDAIIPKDGAIVFSCDKAECHLKLIANEGSITNDAK